MTLPEPTTDLVLLQAATDEACLQYLAVTEALEAALESPRDGTLARRGPHGKRPLGPPTIEDELGPSEGVCVGGDVYLFPRRTLSKCYLCFRASRAGAISRVGFVNEFGFVRPPRARRTASRVERPSDSLVEGPCEQETEGPISALPDLVPLVSCLHLPT